MSQFQPTRFEVMPPVIKNLIIINVLMFVATLVFESQGIPFTGYLGLFPFESNLFEPYQTVTHMFMHGGFGHIFFNMFALWMFGAPLENVWGPKRFLTFYLVTGLGAALLHQGVLAFEIYQLKQVVMEGGSQAMMALEEAKQKLGTPTVGASGAVFGILMAFGVLFANSTIYLYFLFPVKAKYFVTFLIILELYRGFESNPSDNVAHFAHLGGALFGFILLKFWQKDRNRFY